MKTIVGIIYCLLVIPFVINVAIAESSEFTTAQVQWIKESHPTGSNSIQVIEPDMNLSEDKIEKFKIHIWSDSDPDGITPEVYETGKDSGVFTSNIYFSSNPSTGQRLHTVEGDLVIASYEDHTIPASYNEESLEVFDSMIVNKTLTTTGENQGFRVDDPNFTRQSLQTGETLGNIPNTFGWFVLAMSLFIVFAYVVMKIKRRKRK